MTTLISMASFCYFLINFLMGTQPGYIVTNTLSSQISELIADATAILFVNFGLRRAFVGTYLLSAVGSIALFIANNNDV